MEQYQLWNSSRFWCFCNFIVLISSIWFHRSFHNHVNSIALLQTNCVWYTYLSLSFVCCYLFINDATKLNGLFEIKCIYFKCLEQNREKKEIYQSEIVLKIVGSIKYLTYLDFFEIYLYSTRKKIIWKFDIYSRMVKNLLYLSCNKFQSKE